MSFFSDLRTSFLMLPLWVRIWTFLILVPINFAAVLFLGNPGSVLIASLAVSGVAFNAIPLFLERGFTSTMAISHLVFWIPLVIILINRLSSSEIPLSSEYVTFLIVLFVCNLISLAFDIPDVYRWIKDRKKDI